MKRLSTPEKSNNLSILSDFYIHTPLMKETEIIFNEVINQKNIFKILD